MSEKRFKKPKKNSDPTSVTPSQRVKEFNNQKLTVSAGKLFCLACREELSLKKSIIKNHIASTKHTIGKEKINSKEKREKDIAESLKKYDEIEHPSGETLPTSVRVYRVKVCTTFLRAGVPINRIDKFRDILEENGLRLAGRKPMSDLIPFILSEEVQRLKSEVKDKPISVTFDGTCRLGEALAIIVRYVSDTFTIEQRLIKLQILTKSLAGEEIAREVLSVLSTEYGISSYDLVATMRDRASSNNVAIQIMKILYPNCSIFGCYSHTIHHVGERFVTPILTKFGNYWVTLFSHSPKACFLWKCRTGQSIKSYSKTRWWSRWEMFNQMMLYYGDILPFLEDNPDLSPATTMKLKSILSSSKKSSLSAG